MSGHHPWPCACSSSHQYLPTPPTPSHTRSNFLKTGTMAKGAAETGYVEAYMCNKISRNPIVAQSCAEFMGYFQPTDVGGTFARGSQV